MRGDERRRDREGVAASRRRGRGNVPVEDAGFAKGRGRRTHVEHPRGRFVVAVVEHLGGHARGDHLVRVLHELEELPAVRGPVLREAAPGGGGRGLLGERGRRGIVAHREKRRAGVGDGPAARRGLTRGPRDACAFSRQLAPFFLGCTPAYSVGLLLVSKPRFDWYRRRPRRKNSKTRVRGSRSLVNGSRFDARRARDAQRTRAERAVAHPARRDGRFPHQRGDASSRSRVRTAEGRDARVAARRRLVRRESSRRRGHRCPRGRARSRDRPRASARRARRRVHPRVGEDPSRRFRGPGRRGGRAEPARPRGSALRRAHARARARARAHGRRRAPQPGRRRRPRQHAQVARDPNLGLRSTASRRPAAAASERSETTSTATATPGFGIALAREGEPPRVAPGAPGDPLPDHAGGGTTRARRPGDDPTRARGWSRPTRRRRVATRVGHAARDVADANRVDDRTEASSAPEDGRERLEHLTSRERSRERSRGCRRGEVSLVPHGRGGDAGTRGCETSRTRRARGDR